MPRGRLNGVERIGVVDDGGTPLLSQATQLARWPDRSVKWLLLDVLVPDRGRIPRTIHVVENSPSSVADAGHAGARVSVAVDAAGVTVRTGCAEFRIDGRGRSLLRRAAVGARTMLGDRGAELELLGADGSRYVAEIESFDVEAIGPVSAEILVRGRFGDGVRCPLVFGARWRFTADAADACCELMVRNPQPARHPGGVWDLGDEGSWLIRDCSLRFFPASPIDRIRWHAERPGQARETPAQPVCVYQDSSGGERWDSPNHVDACGESGVAFRGYEVRVGGQDARQKVDSGLRAQPCLSTGGGQGWITVTVSHFWQEFPKALRWSGDALEVGLFPAERRRPTELQGGEQKRHRVLVDFGSDPKASPLVAQAEPPHAWVDPDWVAASGAVEGFVADLSTRPEYLAFVDRIVEGPDAFAERREVVDEFGWRHFGDLYGDHEAVGQAGAEAFVSHYNNQYDFVLGAGHHALRTGDSRWMRLMDEAARHTADIDVYHTDGDKPAFNGGLFWHTDHYKPAATATHRTYSRRNAGGRDYGGGPGNEHNYASGLLLHHYLSGDRESRDAVVGLAEWVVAMDDGARTLLGLLDAGPTGLASKTGDLSYHGPGRGSGNSIAVLLDAHALTGQRRYLEKAEELLRRCVHPADDIAARRLEEPEPRWSYLAFLQVLGRYLDAKLELAEIDYDFHYARDSLLHYAGWMLEHEVPYRELLHKVAIPTETWPAQDIRKCHVLHLAARFDGSARAHDFRAKAAFFYERCLADLQTFETRYLTRPLVILCVFGFLHEYYRQHAEPAGSGDDAWRHGYDFGAPAAFVPQRRRAAATFRARLRVARREAWRILRDRLAGWRRRLGRNA